MNTPTIVYVRTDHRGDDVHGTGSHQRPFRSISRARSDYPTAVICLDDTYSNLPPRKLTELGEDVGPEAGRDDWTIVLAALMCGAFAGVTFAPVVGLLVAGLVIFALVTFDRWAAR